MVPEGRRVRPRAALGRAPGPHPQRHGAARAAARGLHRRWRRHHDRRRRRGGVMGATFDAAQSLDAQFVMQTYARKPVMFVRGEGMRLYDDDGRGVPRLRLGHRRGQPRARAPRGHGGALRAGRQARAREQPVLRRAPGRTRARRRRPARRRVADVLRELRRRGHRGRDQARPPLGGGAQARRLQGRLARAQLPRPHARGARRDGPGEQAGGVRPDARGLRARRRRTTSRRWLRRSTTRSRPCCSRSCRARAASGR